MALVKNEFFHLHHEYHLMVIVVFIHSLAMKIIFWISVFFFICIESFSQKIDSSYIQESIASINDDKAKIDYLLTRAQSDLTDSATSLQYADFALNISKAIQYDSGIVNSLHLLAKIYITSENYDKSYDAFDKIFDKYEFEIPASQLSHLHTELGDYSYSTKHYK